MNAANEVAVQAFLDGKLRYTDIYALISQTIEVINRIDSPSLNDYVETDRISRQKAKEILTKIENYIL
jgi:1-deoxy-D-xylulose-5-phosphate reductoisomerase